MIFKTLINHINLGSVWRVSGLRCKYANHSRKWLYTSSVRSDTYEGDGKTTVSVINKENEGYLLINTYAKEGFRLSNGNFAFGPIAIMPSMILQWRVRDYKDINEQSLALFHVVYPKIEVLVIGVGDSGNKLDASIVKFLRKHNMNFEILPTKDAVVTYNFLAVENRVCAGAFIPPSYTQSDEMDLFLTAKTRDELHKSDTPLF